MHIYCIFTACSHLSDSYIIYILIRLSTWCTKLLNMLCATDYWATLPVLKFKCNLLWRSWAVCNLATQFNLTGLKSWEKNVYKTIFTVAMPGPKELGVLHIVWLCGTFYRSSLFLLCFPLGSWGCGSCFVVKSASIRQISLPACQPPASPIIPYQRPLSAIVVFHHLPQTRPAWLFVVVILFVCTCAFSVTMALLLVFVAIVYFNVIDFVHAWCCNRSVCAWEGWGVGRGGIYIDTRECAYVFVCSHGHSSGTTVQWKLVSTLAIARHEAVSCGQEKMTPVTTLACTSVFREFLWNIFKPKWVTVKTCLTQEKEREGLDCFC